MTEGLHITANGESTHCSTEDNLLFYAVYRQRVAHTDRRDVQIGILSGVFGVVVKRCALLNLADAQPTMERW